MSAENDEEDARQPLLSVGNDISNHADDGLTKKRKKMPKNKSKKWTSAMSDAVGVIVRDHLEGGMPNWDGRAEGFSDEEIQAAKTRDAKEKLYFSKWQRRVLTEEDFEAIEPRLRAAFSKLGAECNVTYRKIVEKWNDYVDDNIKSIPVFPKDVVGTWAGFQTRYKNAMNYVLSYTKEQKRADDDLRARGLALREVNTLKKKFQEVKAKFHEDHDAFTASADDKERAGQAYLRKLNELVQIAQTEHSKHQINDYVTFGEECMRERSKMCDEFPLESWAGPYRSNEYDEDDDVEDAMDIEVEAVVEEEAMESQQGESRAAPKSRAGRFHVVSDRRDLSRRMKRRTNGIVTVVRKVSHDLRNVQQIKKLEDPNYEIKTGAAKGFAFMGICDELGQLRLQCSADNCLAPFKDNLREICSAAWNGSTLTPPVVNNNAEKRAADK